MVGIPGDEVVRTQRSPTPKIDADPVGQWPIMAPVSTNDVIPDDVLRPIEKVYAVRRVNTFAKNSLN